MSGCEEKYYAELKKMCEIITLDYFPQAQANDLLYKVITLEDIYLPLTIEVASHASSIFDYNVEIDKHRTSEDDISNLRRYIDARIVELDKEIEKTNANLSGMLTESERKEDLEQGIKKGLRFWLRANPGCGKTTFCKRATLAYLRRDIGFFEKYRLENNLYFNVDRFPLLILGRNFERIALEDIEKNDFVQVAYNLCCRGMGETFLSNISMEEFCQLLAGKALQGKICIIVDGWDEILESQKAEAFFGNLNRYLEENPQTDLIVTIRKEYTKPLYWKDIEDTYLISKLTSDDIRKFCKRWYEVVFSSDPNKQDAYVKVANQILSSRDQRIREMSETPLTLSHLLTLSRQGGKLPENKAELYEKLLELYISWTINKNTCSIGAKTIRDVLAYIATYLTKYDKFLCTYEDLENIIKNCDKDLYGIVSKANISINEFIDDLSRSVVFGKTSGDFFSFSTHRQMQEYLTAYAIVTQNADEEYNNMFPLAIFSEKYTVSRWREVIVFATLMNDGRLRQGIIQDLLTKVQENVNNYVYTNLLFELVVNGADIRIDDKHRIYDIIFKEHITDQQIQNVCLFTTLKNYNSEEFIAYVKSKYAESVLEGKSYYGYVVAIIEAVKGIEENKTPMSRAEELLFSDQEVDIVTGTQIFIMMAWCKYAQVATKSFGKYYGSYVMGDKALKRFKMLQKGHIRELDLAKCIKECLLADFLKYGDMFEEDDWSNWCNEIELCGDESSVEILLSIVPVFQTNHKLWNISVPLKIKNKYLKKLEEEIQEKRYDDIIFTFNLCVAIMCWDDKESIDKQWRRIEGIYENLYEGGYIGKTRYKQLCKYKYGEGDYRLTIDSNHSTEEVSSFLADAEAHFLEDKYDLTNNVWKKSYYLRLVSSIMIENNMAYLLRRHDFVKIERKVSCGVWEEVSPMDIVHRGAIKGEVFSLINASLCISEVQREEYGDYSNGLVMLKHWSEKIRKDRFFLSAQKWWADLAVRKGENEGLIVLYWLHEINCLEIEWYDVEDMLVLWELYIKKEYVFKGKERKIVEALQKRFMFKFFKTVMQAEKNTFDEMFDVSNDIIGKVFQYEHKKYLAVLIANVCGDKYILLRNEQEIADIKIQKFSLETSKRNKILIESPNEFSLLLDFIGANVRTRLEQFGVKKLD